MAERPVAYVCCSHPAPEWRWIGGAVETRLRDQLRGPTTQRDSDTVFLQMDGEPVMIMTVQSPLSPDEMADDAAQRAAWPLGRDVSRTWRSHFIISAMDNSTRLADRRTAVENTLRVAATITGVARGNAVGWCPTGLFHPAGTFAERVAVNPLHPDSILRCDWTVGADDALQAARTRGLGVFGLPELSHVASDEDRGTIRTRIDSLATFVIAHGPVFRPGETVGADARMQAYVAEGADADGAPLLIVTPQRHSLSRAA